MYIIIVLSFLFYTYTYYYILLIIFSRDYLEIFGGRFGRIWMAPVIYLPGTAEGAHVAEIRKYFYFLRTTSTTS